MRDLPFTIAALREAYAGGLSPVDVVAEAYRRIDELGDPGVFLHLIDVEQAMEQAAALGDFDSARDPALPLWGVPFAVKDNIDVAGAPTTAACEAYAYHPEQDAFVVSRLRAAGAIPIGKTNLDQLATGLVGVRTPWPVPRNALDPEIVPGGSSSGSAVAVAHGVVGFALGTDTAGSGRVPAALNNVVGLKPTLGALSASGMAPACRTLDTISVFALTVDDAYAVYRAAAGFDPADPYSRDLPAPPAAPARPPELRVGVPDARSIEFYGDATQEASFAQTAAALAELGCAVTEIDFTPFYDVARMLYEGAWLAERYVVAEELLARDPGALHPVTRRIIEPAGALSAADAFRGFYRLEALKRRVEPALAAVDLLCVPTIPRFYSRADLAEDPIEPNARLGRYTNFVNLLGLCGLATPTPPRADGRPGGVTLLARAGRDALLAALGRELEQLGQRRLGGTDWPVPPLAAAAPRAGLDELELAVCGAHMSGLPLNHELTDRGARFLRAVHTEPCYRLYALPGGPPARPGMLRAAHGEGGAVAVEVWAMPLARVGDFLAGVPAPLGLGSLALADGTTPKGFLCEAAGVIGAEDVTSLGDWRLVLARNRARPSEARDG